MILDADLIFSEKQAVTATAASAKVLDLQEGGDAIGQELTVKAVVGTAFAGGTSLQFKLQTSGDNSTWTDLLMTGAVAVADLKSGAIPFDVRVPKGAKRYLRMQYVAVGTFTGGTVTAFLTKEL
jgi:hypothetical protein